MGSLDLQFIHYKNLFKNTVMWLTRKTSRLRVVILQTGGPATYDDLLRSVLQEIPNTTVTITTVPWHTYTGGDLVGTDIFLPMGNYNWNNGNQMPEAGQQALHTYILNGGSMLTCEWLYWRVASTPNEHITLERLLPIVARSPWVSRTILRYKMITSTPSPGYEDIGTIHQGIPTEFQWTPANISGVETQLYTPKPSSKVFYDSIPAI
jgi:hypothetical protein